MPCRVSGMQESGGVTVGEYPQWSCLYSGALSLCGWVGSHDGTPRGRPALLPAVSRAFSQGSG